MKASCLNWGQNHNGPKPATSQEETHSWANIKAAGEKGLMQPQLDKWHTVSCLTVPKRIDGPTSRRGHERWKAGKTCFRWLGLNDLTRTSPWWGGGTHELWQPWTWWAWPTPQKKAKPQIWPFWAQTQAPSSLFLCGKLKARWPMAGKCKKHSNACVISLTTAASWPCSVSNISAWAPATPWPVDSIGCFAVIISIQTHCMACLFALAILSTWGMFTLGPVGLGVVLRPPCSKSQEFSLCPRRVYTQGLGLDEHAVLPGP